MKKIAFAGLKGAGKDFAADLFLAGTNGYKTSPADPIKQILSQWLGIPDSYLWGSDKDKDFYVALSTFLSKFNTLPAALSGVIQGRLKEWPVIDGLNSWFCHEIHLAPLHEGVMTLSPRGMLQRLGTDFGRKVLGENVWVDWVIQDIADQKSYEAVAVTGIRFKNEVRCLAAAGVPTIKIEREGVVLDPFNTPHASELAVDGIPEGLFAAVLRVPEGVSAAKAYLARELAPWM